MMPDKLLSLARKYIGVTESPAGSNRVVFNTAYYGREVSGSAYPWCMAFQWYLFQEAGASVLFYGGGKTASCGALMRYAKSVGQWVKGDYRPGDLIIFDFEDDGKVDTNHVGLCESVEAGYITTIDGNTGTTSEANGGAVMRRRRAMKYVVGAYRPNYESEANDLSVEDAKKVIKEKAGLSDVTIEFLYNYRYGDSLIVKLAEAMK